MWLYDPPNEPRWDPEGFEKGARGLLSDKDQANFDDNQSPIRIAIFMMRKTLPLLEAALKATMVVDL
jgi:hypothetical protein